MRRTVFEIFISRLMLLMSRGFISATGFAVLSHTGQTLHWKVDTNLDGSADGWQTFGYANTSNFRYLQIMTVKSTRMLV